MGNAIMAVIIGSFFLDLGTTADDIPKRSVLLFFSMLVNAFMSGFEVRPAVRLIPRELTKAT
jgi:ATP-binding cassette subfamily G (WHITE) protein 2 (PDR)